jgi:hypothetical protein
MERRVTADFGKAKGIDARAGFLLSVVQDGPLTVEDLIDLSGLPAHDAAALTLELLDRGALRPSR